MTKKPVLAVDIDEVLSDHAEAFIQFSNQHFGLNNTIDDYSEHWAELFKLNLKGVEKLVNSAYATGMLGNLNSKPDSKEVLTELSDRYDIVIITARRSMYREDTVAWLDKYYEGVFKDVHFTGYWDEITDKSAFATKKEMVKSVGADILIDDQPKHCEAVAVAGIRAILFGDYSWNKDYKSHDNIVKLHNWKEVGDYLWSLKLN